MKSTILLLVLALLPAGVFSQKQSPQQLIYRLTKEEAAEFFRAEKIQPQLSHFHDLVETAPADRNLDLPPGNYLRLVEDRSELSISLISKPSITLQPLVKQGKFAFRILDSLGLPVADAEAEALGGRVVFDRQSLVFILKKGKKNGARLLVRASGEAAIFKVNEVQTGYRQRSGFFRKTAYNIKHPRYWLQKTYRRTVGRLVWRIERRRERDDSYKGYLALNKPKFLPGDTVKVKGYFLENKGKPLRHPLELRLQNSGKWLTIKKVTPATPGAFVTEFSLHDSLNLKLDKSYELAFFDLAENQPRPIFGSKKRSTHKVFSQNFRYEDYQLDQVTYSFSSEKKAFAAGDSVWLTADGTFANGLRIPDGRLRLVVRSNALSQPFQPAAFFEKNVRLPDTLWQTELSLDPAAPTRIWLPDSIFPPVKMEVFASAQFVNSNGELQNRQLSFRREPPHNCLTLNLEGGWLTGDCAISDLGFGISDFGFVGTSPQNPKSQIPNPKSEISTAWLSVAGLGFQYEKQVLLPLRERVNGSAYAYVLRWTEQPALAQFSASVALSEQPDLVEAEGEHRGDSLVFWIKNPRQLPVFFELQTENRQVEQGMTEAENFCFARPANRGDDYRLRYHFTWSGSLKEKSLDMLFFKKKLEVAVEQPPVVEPGATVQVKVKVQDHRRRAARNVNLAAGSVNAEFRNYRSFTSPEIQRKAPKFSHLRRFDWNKPEFKRTTLPLTKDWAVSLQLDTQFLFVSKGILLRYDTLTDSSIINQQTSIQDTFFKNVAQFAPYLIADGVQQAIVMIYCNRQLVWFYGCDDNQPYSFIGRPGWNQIKLRTRHFEYEMDSVWLEKGCKLELVIHPTEFHRSPLARHVRKNKAPLELTAQEKTLVQYSFFVLRPGGAGVHAVMQGNENIHVFTTVGSQGQVRLGPFRPNAPLDYVWRDSFRTQIKFEPGFSYKISPERERLYEYKWFPHVLPLPQRLPSKRPGDLVFTPADVLEKSPQRQWRQLKFSKATGGTKRGNGSFLFYFPKKMPPLLAILLESPAAGRQIFQPHQRQFRDLEPGEHRLVLVGEDSSVLQTRFTISPNTLIFSDLNHLDFRRDSSGFWLNAILEQSQPKQERMSAAPKIPKASSQFGARLSGVVTDQTGEALIGVSIFVRGTSEGTVTDVDGSYQLIVPPGATTLVFSYTGFTTQEVEIGQASDFSVVMQESAEQLQEVVVTALGISSERRNLSSSVAGLKREEGMYFRSYNPAADQGKKDWSLQVPDFQTTDYDFPPLEPGLRLRKNFRDEGFWQPNLATDANGEAWFTVTLPDNVTRWNTFVLGMDERQRAGAGFASTNAFRQLMAQLAVPRFLVEGDRVEVIGKALNYTDDTLDVTTAFSLGETVVKSNVAAVGNALIEKMSVVASSANSTSSAVSTTTSDSLTLRYTLASGSYGDGEERHLPIFPKGTDESAGGFFLLQNDTSLTLNFPAEKGEITLRAEANVLEILSGSLDYLIQYPYGCTEQVSGRLLALLLAKELKTALGEPFEREDFIKKAIETLSKTQHPNGFWGWWQGGTSNLWMTGYALGALLEAKRAGYPNPALEKGLTWLTHRLDSLENHALLDALELFSDAGQNLDYSFYLSNLDSTLRRSSMPVRHVSFVEKPLKNLRPLTLDEQFTMLKIRQAQGLPHSLDLLEQTLKTDLHGDIFWGETENHSWQHGAIRTTLLACHLLKKAGKTDPLAAAQRWLLRLRKRQGNWGNTIETAQVLAYLLPEILAKTGGNLRFETSLKVNGGEAFREFPLEIKLSPGAPLRLEKTGNADVYLTAYQTFWNPDPAPKTDIFNPKTWLMQGEKITTSLETGKPATLEIELTNAQVAEYVMLEAPIPAGCSYGEKVQAGSDFWQGGKWVRSHEVHREYFKEKAALFFETLPPGTHRFSIALEPRFSGSFTLNPARVEEMYFPVFFGRNGVGEVTIE